MKDQNTSERMEQNASAVADTVPGQFNTQTSAPMTKIERLVAKCWEEELKVTGIGLEDDFFALGGDSQSALQMIFRVQEQLPPVLPLPHLFSTIPTPKGLQAKIWEFFPGGD